MDKNELALLKSKIDKAKLVSFDIFDTLLFRKINNPETVFDMVGKHFGIHGFKKLRIDAGIKNSETENSDYKYPYAETDKIYRNLAENYEISVDWNEVKRYELQIEKDALVTNDEILEIVRYVKDRGKQVVAISNTGLSECTLKQILTDNSYSDIDYVYSYTKESTFENLLKKLKQQDRLLYSDMLHIGTESCKEYDNIKSLGISTFVYQRVEYAEKLKNTGCSEVDNGIYKVLYNKNRGFWYNIGVEAGGPIYMGLYRYLMKEIESRKSKIYFLPKGGYNMYHVFKNQSIKNIEYVDLSHCALVMATITEMNEEDIAELPPYSYGQTVGEILNYLSVDRNEIRNLGKVGFSSFDDVISSEEDIIAFKKLYIYDKEVFLRQCVEEREKAIAYFKSIDFFENDSICFDFDWYGKSRTQIEKFKKSVGIYTSHYYIFRGIKSCEKSFRNMRGIKYSAYLFDFYKNYHMQYDIIRDMNMPLYELFFPSYDNDNNKEPEKEDILNGICDFIRTGLDFVNKYNVEYTPEISLSHLNNIINYPTEEEAVTIGNLFYSEEIASGCNIGKRIAYISSERKEKDKVYWLNGLLKRPDIADEVKSVVAARYGVGYPQSEPKYHLEYEGNIRNYHRWLNNHVKDSYCEAELQYQPYFSIVIPVYNTITSQLEECIQSVLTQTYKNYELILVDDHSSWKNVKPILQKYEKYERVRVIYRSENGHISVATNDGISIAKGDYIVFMDCDDIIEKNSLYEFALKLNENPEIDFIYSDDNKITEDGKIRHMPFFKPDWSPDLFMNMMYTNHLAAYRTSIVKETGGLRTAYNGSQDYDFTLRFMEKSDNKRVGHVPKVLYHWRERKESVAYTINSKNYAAEAARFAKEDYIKRNSLNAHMEYISGLSQYRIVYEVTGNPLVSIIIPSKDNPEILIQCIDSIINFTDYKNYEIIVVDNGSNSKNKEVISEYLNVKKAQYIYKEEIFNFSAMCNRGVSVANGDYLLFLNDDIEIFQPEWLERLLGHAQQKHTGAVGAKLYYPQSTIIQHAGVANSTEHGRIHSFIHYNDNIPYYFGLNWVDYNTIAVTGACLMVSVEKFKEVGGYDENLPVAYNDVKLCFALHEKGYYNVVRNDVMAYHHESLSRGNDMIDENKLIRLYKEKNLLFSRFENLDGHDPYLNGNLNTYSEAVDLKLFYDELVETDLSRCHTLKRGEVEQINVSNRIQIIGWAIPNDGNSKDDVEKYVIFKDMHGNTYTAKTVSMQRPDVAESFDNPNYMYSGFECILREKELRLDIMPYMAGIMLIDKKGNKYVKWCKETGIMRNPPPRPSSLRRRKIDFIPKYAQPNKVKWYIDECDRQNSYYRIRGFAFKKDKMHYKYEKVLVLSDESGLSYEFDVHNEERLDVAYTFPEEQYLFYTGFMCLIYEGSVKMGREYSLSIRLKNVFDSSDVLDIATNYKIKL